MRKGTFILDRLTTAPEFSRPISFWSGSVSSLLEEMNPKKDFDSTLDPVILASLVKDNSYMVTATTTTIQGALSHEQ